LRAFPEFVKAKDREMSNSESNLLKQGLDGLRGIAIAAHLAVCKAEEGALDSALRAGEALRSAVERKLVRHDDREDFYRETCGHERVGRRYVYLAKNRDVIDANRTRESDLSIAAAMRLIRAAKGTKEPKGFSSPSPKGPPAPALKSFDDWTNDEIRDALFKLGYPRFRTVIPDQFRPRLEAHAGAQMLRRERERHPNLRLKNIDALRLVVDNTEEEAPPTQH
jgi:hypothetical protein